MKTTDTKECYGDHFKCDECTLSDKLLKEEWKVFAEQWFLYPTGINK